MMMSSNGKDNSGEFIEPLTETRIYVRGLGITVTEDDLRNTFGSLGKLNKVDIIRTKGRGFAYLDFVPFSDKSLTRLFSMYNDCMWKGGRLKLEKAKEHYLIRLKNEWAEDAELANGTVNDAVKTTDSLETLTKVMINQKTSEIRLFFPKLRKLKPLPFNGTGKHKYSFQRIEVPKLPIHFCDCDEHSKPLYPTRENKLFIREVQDGGIDEREFKIMESVMNKLFQKTDKSKLQSEKENASKTVDIVVVDHNEEDNNVNENDNLVLNIVPVGNVRKGWSTSLRQGTRLDNERAVVNSLQRSKAKASENKQMGRRTQTLPVENKRKPPNDEPTDGKVASFVKKPRPYDIIDDIAIHENEADDMTEEDDDLVLNMLG